MTFSIAQIAAALGATAHGAVDMVVRGLAEPAGAGPDDLALAMSEKYAPGLAAGQARAAVVWPGADWQGMGLQAAIIAPRARLAMAQLTQMLDVPHDLAAGVHPTALIDPTAVLGQGVRVGAFSLIGAGARIGDDTAIADHVSIAAGAVIGAGGLILPGVRIMRHVTIGDRVIIQPNAVIGGDGFSFVTGTPAHEEVLRKTLGRVPLGPPDDATRHRIHSLGGVSIGNDVEIGANSTVDAGTIRATQVGDGTKIDNLVQVGHNVIIGRDCLLCAHAAVAGSARIGDRVVLAGKAGVGDNITIGSDVVLTGAAVALSDVPAGSVMTGTPAVPMQDYLAQRRLLRQLRRGGGQKAVSKPGKTD